MFMFDVTDSPPCARNFVNIELLLILHTATLPLGSVGER